MADDTESVTTEQLRAAYLAGYNRYGLEMAGWNKDGISDDPDKAFDAWLAKNGQATASLSGDLPVPGPKGTFDEDDD